MSHLFGQGFPKSLNVQRAIDEFLCERPGRHYWAVERLPKSAKAQPDDHVCDVTDAGREFEGYGTALKPAIEDWWLVKKPNAKSLNTAANLITHGVGALNVDACRVEYLSEQDRESAIPQGKATSKQINIAAEPDAGRNEERTAFVPDNSKGRWPANVVLSHSSDCVQLGQMRVATNTHYPAARPSGHLVEGHAGQNELDERTPKTESVERWACVPDCAVRMLDAQSAGTGASGRVRGTEPSSVTNGIYGAFAQRLPSILYVDTGGASRFFYCGKASTQDRDEGLDSFEPRVRDAADGSSVDNTLKGPTSALRPDQATRSRNTHPTVKSTSLMRWLCKLVTPSGGVIVDPFMSSGSTGKACALEQFGFIGCDKDRESCDIAQHRIMHATRQGVLF